MGKIIHTGDYFTTFAITKIKCGHKFALKWFKDRNEQALNELSIALYLKAEKGDAFLKCYEIFDFEGQLFLVYEAMDGDLYDHIRNAEYPERLC